MKKSKVSLLAIAALVLAGCAQQPKDYSAYKAADPKTILILPPKHSTPEVGATYGVYSNTQLPVAESGYYVLPITLVDEHFKANGLTVPDDIHQVDRAKLREVFGADAALYINVTDYGTRYFVIGSASVVTAEARLVDLRTGTELWTGKATANSDEGNNNQGGLAALLIGALVKQMIGTATDQSQQIAKMTTLRLLSANSPGSLLPGPRSPNYKK
ncbi:MAG: DUF799 domain-containing protein [Gammaproteobacteria bacterium]|nr:DUF799 domain-containing protein [Gammaproteobacteria bacterium]MBU0787701.1 DUF799 domain-containing protein [Gammaproteobacteria bacterium]MBU0814829.1 DUF799 domain-containing protein [Gammaproteobacteria bacterium]MBU1786063.1 DUF799 domain-containing protein [Gammaproteobacteria bacterium]